MRKNLPDLPKINRFITEDVVSLRTLFLFKVLLVSLVSSFLVIQITREIISLPKNIAEAQSLQGSREQIAQEIMNWKKIADQYTGYRDVYYRIALLEYMQGNLGEVNTYLQKALDVDPNFDAGRVLGAKIER